MGEVEDKEPVYLGEGMWGLACPGCGRPDDLTWLPDEAAWPTLAEAAYRAEQRRLDRAETPARRVAQVA
jgi:hypothetical protein